MCVCVCVCVRARARARIWSRPVRGFPFSQSNSCKYQLFEGVAHTHVFCIRSSFAKASESSLIEFFANLYLLQLFKVFGCSVSYTHVLLKYIRHKSRIHLTFMNAHEDRQIYVDIRISSVFFQLWCCKVLDEGFSLFRNSGAWRQVHLCRYAFVCNCHEAACTCIASGRMFYEHLLLSPSYGWAHSLSFDACFSHGIDL
jgi:hypothetical protein